MTDDAICALVAKAFSDVPRPVEYTPCRCDECGELALLLHQRDNDSLQAADIAFQIPLLSPESFRSFTPAFIRLALAPDNDDFFNNYVFSDLGTPISRKSPPNHHPIAALFTPEQTEAVLTFLIHIDETCYEPHEQRPRELVQAIRNWQQFAGASDDA